MSRGGGIPAEALLDFRRRLEQLPPRHAERRILVNNAAQLFGMSRAAIYRALKGQLRPLGLRRADCGSPRKIPRANLERYCELVAALKIRTSNRKGRRLSTARAIELIEAYGVPQVCCVQRSSGGLGRALAPPPTPFCSSSGDAWALNSFWRCREEPGP